MSTRPPRWVVVDDTDTSIQYSGPWVQVSDVSIYDVQGNWGPTYSESLHGTTGIASLSYAFNGTQAAIYGAAYITNDDGVQDPIWQCFMDGISNGTRPPSLYQYENNWVFCQWNSIPDGPHVMSVNVTSNGQTFWFDELRYSPTAGASINGGAILFDSRDPDIYLDSQWVEIGSYTFTSTRGATMTLDFFGTNLTWYGTILGDIPQRPTTATYTVDNHSAVTFTLSGLPNANNGNATHGNANGTVTNASGNATLASGNATNANRSDQYNQKVFQTTPLPLGNHTLKVVYQGNDSLIPLVLDYLIIQNQTNSASEIISFGNTSKGPLVGAIVGGTIGSVSALVLSIVIYLVVRRRKRRSNANTAINNNGIIAPFFTAPPSQLDTRIYGTRTTEVLPASQHKRMPLASFSNNAGITTSTSSSGFGSYPPNESQPRQVASPAIVASASDGEPHPPLATTRRIVHHQDSGIRVPNTEIEEVVDVPPNYTTV